VRGLREFRKALDKHMEGVDGIPTELLDPQHRGPSLREIAPQYRCNDPKCMRCEMAEMIVKALAEEQLEEAIAEAEKSLGRKLTPQEEQAIRDCCEGNPH